MRFATLYEIPPRAKPAITGTMFFARLKASSISEKVKAATSTPAPKAIIEAITFLGRLTKEASIAPSTKGRLATKPHSRDSRILFPANVPMPIQLYLAANLKEMIAK